MESELGGGFEDPLSARDEHQRACVVTVGADLGIELYLRDWFPSGLTHDNVGGVFMPFLWHPISVESAGVRSHIHEQRVTN
jgi:hypothetical protein